MRNDNELLRWGKIPWYSDKGDDGWCFAIQLGVDALSFRWWIILLFR